MVKPPVPDLDDWDLNTEVEISFLFNYFHSKCLLDVRAGLIGICCVFRGWRSLSLF